MTHTYRADIDGLRAVALLSVVLNTGQRFCDTASCAYENNDKLLYKNSGHLSLEGATIGKNKLTESLGPYKKPRTRVQIRFRPMPLSAK